MDRPLWARAAGQGNIQPFAAQTLIKRCIGQPRLFGAQGGVNFVFQQVQVGPRGFAGVRVHFAQRRHQGRDFAFFPQGRQAHLF